jgi:hypothetical protein
VAAVLTAVFSGSFALAAVFTPSELLAAVPAAGSIGCLVAARRSGRAAWLVGAGALAVTAPLIKQSFLDAGAAGAVFVLASAAARPQSLPRNAAAYAAGAAIPCAALAVLLSTAHMSAHGLGYALFGFRVDALRTLAASALPLQTRIRGLLDPVLGSGMLVGFAVVPFGLWALRGDRVLAVTLGAWVAAGAVGVLGGGSYWAHYLIQLAVPVAVLAGTAVSRAAPPRGLVVAPIVAIAVAITVSGAATVHRTPPHATALALARYVRTHARPGDTQYVMYAHANIDFYSGLQSPYPYAWSLMDRAVPGAIPRLRHLLGGRDRPTWVVGWNSHAKWGLDRDDLTKQLLRTRYRRVAMVARHPIYLRTDRAVARHVAADTRRSPA